jgi:hypothetical protein
MAYLSNTCFGPYLTIGDHVVCDACSFKRTVKSSYLLFIYMPCCMHLYMFQGAETISDYAISFHYVSVEEMYRLEFYIYHLRPYGINSGRQDLNRPHVPLASPRPRALPPHTNQSVAL